MGEPAAALTASDWNFACPDWVQRLRERRSLVPELPIDRAEGDRAVALFNKLRLPDVVGQPTMAEAAGDWFRDIVRSAFGSLDKETGRRRVAEIFALVPKKNSKTTGGAGIMLTALLMNERPNAELLFVGPTQEIANLAFDQASGMIDADTEGFLQKRFQVRDHVKEIVDRRTGATLKIKTFDMKVMTGSKPVVVLVDELHIMSSFSYATRVIGQIRGGLLANPESLLIFITTQSDQPPAGVFKAELQRARGIRDGRITGDVPMLPILYEFPEKMQRDKAKPWLDPANWPMVTPNMGLSIDLGRLISDFKTANDLGEVEVQRWASQHLNIEIGLGLHSDRWSGADDWEAAREPGLTLDSMLARCDVVVAGIDGGGMDDLLALVLLGRCKETRDWLAWGRAWGHAKVLKRDEIAERLQDFVKDGDLVICDDDDPNQDIRELADLVKRVRDAGVLPENGGVGLDPQGVAVLVDELAERDIKTAEHGGPVVGVAQGYRLNGSILGAERKLAGATLWHCGQPLMAWAVGNAKSIMAGNAVMITKETAGKAKIDPLMALFNAVALMSRNPEPPAGAVDFEALIMAGGGLR